MARGGLSLFFLGIWAALVLLGAGAARADFRALPEKPTPMKDCAYPPFCSSVSKVEEVLFFGSLRKTGKGPLGVHSADVREALNFTGISGSPRDPSTLGAHIWGTAFPAPLPSELPSKVLDPAYHQLPSADQPASGTAATAPAPASALGAAEHLEATAAQRETERAAQTLERSRSVEKVAYYELSFADTLAKHYDEVKLRVAPLLAGSDEASRREALDFLARSTTPPERYARVYRRLELNTNQDVLDRAPDYVKNLSDDSQIGNRMVQELRSQSEQDQEIASQIDSFRETLSHRIASMQSLQGPSRALASAVETGSRPAGGAAGVDASAPGLEGAKDGVLASAQTGSAAAQLAPPPAKGDAPGARGGKKLATTSLRDELRRKLATPAKAGAPTTGGGGGARGASATEELLAFAASAVASRGTAASEGGTAEPASREPRFQLAGQETETAVRKLLAGDDEAGAANAAAFGNPEISVFQRVRSFLTRCQHENRVGSRR